MSYKEGFYSTYSEGEKKEVMEAIQETYSLNPSMFTHVQDAPIVPEEVRKQYVEAVGAELAQRKTIDWEEEERIASGRHLLDTASFLNKEGLE